MTCRCIRPVTGQPPKPAPLNIDLTSRDAIDVSIFLRGYQAARAGQPFSETASDVWRDGYAFFAHMRL